MHSPRTSSDPPTRIMSRGGFWQRADKVPFASRLLCRWLLLRERWRRKRNDLEKDIVKCLLSRYAKRVDLPNVDWWRFPNGLRWNAPFHLYRTLRYVHRNSDRLCQASALL